MNVALCTDEKYSQYSLVTIVSLFENNRDHEIVVTIITDGLSKKSRSKFFKLAAYYSQTINVVEIDVDIIRNLKTIEGYFPISMYYRYFLPQILSEQNRVLYLDCDIMVRADLSEFYDSDLENVAGMVIVDQNCDSVAINNRLGLNGDYFNSGVILMNLNYWRKNDIFNKLVNFAANNSSILVYPDQDALNVVLDGKVKYADYRYNMQELWLDESMKNEIHLYKWKFPELEESKKNPAIVHFCTIRKPWFKECINPFLEEYLSYARLLPFVNFKPKYRAPFIYRLYYSIRRRF